MVVVIEWQVVIDDKFYEMGPSSIDLMMMMMMMIIIIIIIIKLAC